MVILLVLLNDVLIERGARGIARQLAVSREFVVSNDGKRFTSEGPCRDTRDRTLELEEIRGERAPPLLERVEIGEVGPELQETLLDEPVVLRLVPRLTSERELRINLWRRRDPGSGALGR